MNEERNPMNLVFFTISRAAMIISRIGAAYDTTSAFL